ncbi:MAG TPA: hypothetical protein VN541_03355, partial [Tepidisphaeraceae bacterium]|nr:hypothetical protein [Tepidisphaeraceae bacterium]
MRRRDWVLLFLGSAAAVVLPAAGARGDYVQFDDSQPTGVTVGGNGFIGAPLTLNGSQVLTTNTYSSTQYATLPKGADITFQGSDTSFSTPYTFNTTYIVLPSAGSTTPAAELELIGTPAAQEEQFNGRFIGYGDPNLPATIPAGATTLVADSTGSTYFTSGQGTGTTGFAFVIDPRAVPEPASFALLGSIGMGVLI